MSMSNNRVLLLGGNFYPEPTGIGKFNGEMVDWLTAHGYRCTVITSYPYYPFWQVQRPYIRKAYRYRYEIRNLMSYYATPIEIYRCPQYVPRNPTGFKRMLLDFTFTLSASLVLLKLLFDKRFDYVISVVPSFQLGLLGLLYRSIRGGKFLYHIQDLQIDAAKDLKMIRSPLLLGILFRLERLILRHADVVSSISPGMIGRVSGKCNRDVLLFPNWVDTRSFFPVDDKPGLKKEFGFRQDDTVVLYSGAIGEKQGLDTILHTAASLADIPTLKFVICGTGPYLQRLKDLKAELKLKNVVFMPLQPAKVLNRFLNMADIHLVVQKKKASDLVMPSKLTNILATGGLSIVTAEKGSSLHQVIERHRIGIAVEPEDPEALASAICRSVSVDQSEIRNNARHYATQTLSIDKVMVRYANHMKEIAGIPVHGIPETGGVTSAMK